LSRALPALALLVTLAGGPPASAQDAGGHDAGVHATDGGEASAEHAHPSGIHVRDLAPQSVPWWQRVTSFLGIFVMVAIAWGLSSDRRRFPWRIVAWGIGLQLVFGVFVLKTSVGLALFSFLNDVVTRLLEFTDDGSRFLFGDYLSNEFTVALNVLPTIIFFSSLMSVAYHYGLMQRLVSGVAWVMQRTLKTSGAETLSAAANIFVGQTEAPLVVRPFVATMTRSELMAVMTGGFAGVAGGVLAAYVGMPETETPVTADTLEMTEERPHANGIDAAAGGAADGLKLALNVGAMLLAFIALVSMVNFVIGLPALWHNESTWEALRIAIERAGQPLPDGCASPEGAEALHACIERGLTVHPGDFSAWQPWSLQRGLGYLFWPIAFAMGVPVEDCATVAALLGEKLVLNEFVAYLDLAHQLEGGSALSQRSVVIATYALCGFANLGSIAIQIGGIGGIAPERRPELARLGLRAMIAGTLATNMTACIAGLLV